MQIRTGARQTVYACTNELGDTLHELEAHECWATNRLYNHQVSIESLWIREEELALQSAQYQQHRSDRSQ
jgi:hypothetical protein